MLYCPHWKPASTVRKILLQNCHIPISLGKCLSHGIIVFSTILPGIQGQSLQDCPMHPRLGFTHLPFCDMKVSVTDSLTALYSPYGTRLLYLSNVYFYDIGLGGNFREKVQIFSRFYLRCSKIIFISVQPDLKMCLTCLLIHLLCLGYIQVYQRRWALSFAYFTIPDFFCQVFHTCLSQDKVFPWNELNITTCHKDSVNKKMS